MDQITEMKTSLTEQSKTLREKLVSIEQEFNTTKEAFFRVQGALEALQAVENVQAKSDD